MDLVDEQDVAVFEVGEQSRQIARLGDHRPGCGAKSNAEFLGHDLGQRRLAKPRRAGEQDVVQRITARAGRLNEDAQICSRLGLPDEVVERLRADRGVCHFRIAGCGGH